MIFNIPLYIVHRIITHKYYNVKSSVPLWSLSSLKLLWSEAVRSSSKFFQFHPQTKTSYLSLSVQQTAAPKETNPRNPQWINKESVDIWRWCHTPFHSYWTQLCKDSDNIRFKFHFLVRETHKAVCTLEIAKRKPRFREERKNEEIISRNSLPHHKRARNLINTRSSSITISSYIVEILSNKWERAAWQVVLVIPRHVIFSLWRPVLVTPRWMDTE